MEGGVPALAGMTNSGRRVVLEHDAPKLTDFGDNIMLQIIDFDHVYDFGLIQSKIIVI
jgi:hypothetical protein